MLIKFSKKPMLKKMLLLTVLTFTLSISRPVLADNTGLERIGKLKDVNKSNKKNSKSTDFENTIFAISINQNPKFQINLSRKGKLLTGSDFSGDSIKLKGSIDQNGYFIMYKLNTKLSNKKIEIFKGQISDGSISGTWSRADGSNKMPFDGFISAD